MTHDAPMEQIHFTQRGEVRRINDALETLHVTRQAVVDRVPSTMNEASPWKEDLDESKLPRISGSS